MAPRLLAPLASIAIALAAAPAGAAFSEIQPALDAAAPGDVVLVTSGTYARFMISNKAIASGSVRVQDCRLRGADGNALPAVGCAKAAFDWGWDGARLYQSAGVAFTRCVLEGGRGADEFDPATCSGTPATGPSGGDAGGAGLGASGGAGGSAVRCEASSLARALACALEPAASGVALPVPNAVPAPVFAGVGAIVAVTGGAARSFALPSVLRGAEPVLLQFAGAAGDAAFLFAAPLPASVYAPAGSGLVGPLFRGLADGGGQLAVAAAAPALPAGVLELGVHLQAAAASAAAGGAVLTGTSHLTLMPAGL